ncbi:MAG: preprotein translocase subunit SecG [bacterium]|jgi:preprotein translocase subunit SecG|nr:preprotein translocase subunit SecG [Chitinophagaceae bacterium]
MTTIFIILIILVSVLLGVIVLIQNPKGGGLAGNIAGFSNQFMGVKQTTDVLEKGTWVLSSILVVLCLISALVINSGKSTGSDTLKSIPTTTGNAAPQQAPAPAPMPQAPAPAATQPK